MINNNVLQPLFQTGGQQKLRWGSLPGASASLAIAQFAIQHLSPILIITPDMHETQRFQRELAFFSEESNLPILPFPDWETLPYDHFSPHEDIISERLKTLYYLPQLKKGIVIAPISTLMHRLLPHQYLTSQSFLLSVNETLNTDAFRQQLIQNAYRHVGEVMEHGEFAIRGSIIDVFPMGSRTPYRIELFDDFIETIRQFDPESQRSIAKQNQIQLLPAQEYPLNEEGITHFRQQWRASFPGNPLESPLYEKISAGEPTPGIEYYLPLFFNKLNTFFDYLPKNTTVFLHSNIEEKSHCFWKELTHRYEQLRYDTSRPLCDPTSMFLSTEQCFKQLKAFTQISLHKEQLPEAAAHYNFNAETPPELTVDAHQKAPFAHLQQFIDHFDGTILFCAESTGRRETLMDLMKEINLHPLTLPNWSVFLEQKPRIALVVAPLDEGLLLKTPNIMLITEPQLFGQHVMQRRLRKRREQDPSTIIRNLTELTIGAPIVHIDHGVGRYRGLQIINTGGQEAEYLTLEYANEDKIYVPITSLHLISRYTGGDPESAPLQKLGTRQWERIKKKATERMRDVAAELLDVYSRREASVGFAFPKPKKEFQQFRDAFPFEETPDQKTAIDDVIRDMTRIRSMDRLICGDVGFGKTEVAMQAAFLAAHANKQVIVLVPTTLLAAQHLQNFQDRFSDWPIKIAGLSRMTTPHEQKNTIDGLKNGTIDIVIGTHKLLNPEIQYKDLGLLIVDEEHRFGVRQKERIKSLRAHIDILTLTATPIPRTLNMSLAGTRDLSIIATPPEKRLAIKTFIHESRPPLIREAVLRESLRGGQVYFLHNEVDTIQATAEKLQKIVPEARIATAHGQMRERELEQVMSNFYHQHFNLLVCSTIIESGIDVPSANTIIINRADKFGLAQLHQLRGRVGRSHHQAYAYLLVPPEKAITRDAKKRLDALMSIEDLGAGFLLATHDLEIRGAGELLGEEQSGQMHAIGFSLYMDLLDQTVKALQEGRDPDIEKPLHEGTEVDLHQTALIPESYVMDVHIRLTLYKRLSAVKTKEDIQQLKAEMVDRFGLLPEPTETLFKIAYLKHLATPLGIKKIDAGKQKGTFTFEEKSNINPSAMVALIQKQPNRYQITSANTLCFMLNKEASTEEKITEIQTLIKALSLH